MAFNEPRYFSVTYDSTTKLMSGVVLLLFASISLVTQSVLLACIATALMLLSYAYSPRGYTVGPGFAAIQRRVGTVSIPLVETREIRTASANDLQGCVRLWGNGGLFGYYGLFRTSKLGKCTWYVTDRKKLVVLITRTKTFLLSPDDVNGFVSAIREAASEAPVAPDRVSGSTQAHGGRSSTGVLAGVGIAVAMLAVVAFALLYAPGPPRLTLLRDTLTIHDRFYPVTLNARDVDLTKARIVNIAADPDWRPTARTNGFANAHYHSGWFRVSSGRSVRMYWEHAKQLVLLPAKNGGAPVLIEVNDPEQFLSELRREWGGSS